MVGLFRETSVVEVLYTVQIGSFTSVLSLFCIGLFCIGPFLLSPMSLLIIYSTWMKLKYCTHVLDRLRGKRRIRSRISSSSSYSEFFLIAHVMTLPSLPPPLYPLSLLPRLAAVYCTKLVQKKPCKRSGCRSVFVCQQSLIGSLSAVSHGW